MLILDQNLSYKIAKRLVDAFPGISHVSDLGLVNVDDYKIWKFAKENNYSIVTFDNDFLNFSILYGNPPKIILLKTGNRKTNDLVDFLLNKKDFIIEFITSESLKDAACLELH